MSTAYEFSEGGAGPVRELLNLYTGWCMKLHMALGRLGPVDLESVSLNVGTGGGGAGPVPGRGPVSALDGACEAYGAGGKAIVAFSVEVEGGRWSCRAYVIDGSSPARRLGPDDLAFNAAGESRGDFMRRLEGRVGRTVKAVLGTAAFSKPPDRAPGPDGRELQ
jgi:hypothetical protein